MLGSIGTDIQNIANKVKTSIESTLNKTFKTYNVVKSDPPFDPAHSSYRMEVLTDDNGVVRVKTVRKESGHEWESYVEQYDQGGEVKAIGGGPNSATALSSKGKISKGLKDLADSIRKDVETSLNKTFNTYNVVSSYPEYAPEHASYRMELQTDNEGIVTVKTVKKENGQEWETSVESYDHGKKLDQPATGTTGTTGTTGATGTTGTTDATYSADQLAESMKALHLKVRNDLEKSLNKQFNTFNVVKHDPPYAPEHSSYRLEVQTEENGHVKVTTVKKEDGHEWTTSVAEYDQGSLVSGSQAAQ